MRNLRVLTKHQLQTRPLRALPVQPSPLVPIITCTQHNPSQSNRIETPPRLRQNHIQTEPVAKDTTTIRLSVRQYSIYRAIHNPTATPVQRPAFAPLRPFFLGGSSSFLPNCVASLIVVDPTSHHPARHM